MTALQIPRTLIEATLLIDGQWVKGSGERIEICSPHTGNPIGHCSGASREQVNSAIDSAQAAQVNWARTPIKERSKILYQLRNILLRDLDEISHLKASESGKTFIEGKAGLQKGIEVLEFALSIQNLDLGGRLEVSRGVSCEYRREPLGVVANITPFNFPAMVPMWTLPIAIVLGNSYIWKPSDKTPLTSLRIGQAFSEAGLPKGILTILHGSSSVVEQIIDHPLVKAVGFVGSTPVAKKVYQRGTNRGIRVLALGGAKNHIVLLPDASPELAGLGISDSFTGCAGQRCMAASVLLMVGNCENHLSRIIERASQIKLGQDMGAIITKAQRKFLDEAITRAANEGAKILLDGRKAQAPKGFENGNWLGPTIIDHVDAKSFAATDELFGPVLSVIRCQDISQAMQIENRNPYGNACSVFTSSGVHAERVIREAASGMVGVNVGVPVPREPFSFGGVNSSKFGSGDITGHHSLDFWSDVKKVTMKWEAQVDQNWMS